MNGFKKYLAATFLSTTMLFTGVAQAMQIQQFDKMVQDDRADYVSELIQGAEKVLADEGRADQADQVSKLFTTNAPDGHISIGMSDFMLDLAKARLADAKRAGQDPNARRLEVEDAMFVTLKKNGIELQLLHRCQQFQAQVPAGKKLDRNPAGLLCEIPALRHRVEAARRIGACAETARCSHFPECLRAFIGPDFGDDLAFVRSGGWTEARCKSLAV